MDILGRMEPAVPPFTAPHGRGRHRCGHGLQRRVLRVRVHADVDVEPSVVVLHEGQRQVTGPVLHLLLHVLRTHSHLPFTLPLNRYCQR